MDENTTPDIEIDFLGGNCPVQAEGRINGQRFYFRSRGQSWTLGIGGELIETPAWEHAEWYGEWPEAGWITTEQAEAFIRQAAERYARGEAGGRLEDDPDRLAKARKQWRAQAGLIDEEGNKNV